MTLDSFALLPRWESDKVQALWILLCADKWLDKWKMWRGCRWVGEWGNSPLGNTLDEKQKATKWLLSMWLSKCLIWFHWNASFCHELFNISLDVQCQLSDNWSFFISKAKVKIHFSVKQYTRQVYYGNKRKCTLSISYSTIIFLLSEIMGSEHYMYRYLELILDLYILRRMKTQLDIPEIIVLLQTFNGSVLYVSG